MEITSAKAEELKRLEQEDLNKMENILHINDEAKKIEINNRIEQIDTKGEYIVHLDSDKIIINLGDASNLNNRMFYIKAILKRRRKFRDNKC